MSASISIDLLPAANATPEEVVADARELRKAILGLHVAGVQSPVVPAPVGAKTGDAASVATLVVAAVPTAHILRSIVNIAIARLSRDSLRSITLKIENDEIEISGLSSADQTDLVAAWIERHSPPADD